MDSERTAAELELAELVVEQVAPEEQELFGVISDAYGRDPQRFADPVRRDEMLGFGVETATALLTPIILAAIGEVAKYLATAGMQGWLRRFGKRSAEPVEALDPAQLARVREIVVEKCRQAGVADKRSELVADGVVGALTSR